MQIDRILGVVLGVAVLGMSACSSEQASEPASKTHQGGKTSGGAGGKSGTDSDLAGSTFGGSMGGTNIGGAAATSGGASMTTAASGGTPSTRICPPAAGAAGTTGNDSSAAGMGNENWVGTWVSAQMLIDSGNKPPSPGLTNSTLRQVVHVSIGGSRLRLRFSNDYGTTPLTINTAHCAVSTGGHGIDICTDRELTFAGSTSVTIPAKQSVWSDPFDFPLAPLSNLTVTTAFGETSSDITGHPGSRTTSYLQAGNLVSAETMPAGLKVDHWYILSGVDVAADGDTHAIVILGDSIADGYGTTTNGNDRWPDVLARRLQANSSTAKVSVLNQGIGGNALMSGGLGPTAYQRFDNDVLKQSGVRWVIVSEGVNDLGYASSDTANNLSLIYKQFVTKAHAANLLIYGVPVLPFNGHSYYTAAHEAARQTLNTYIRTPGNFDAVIDLDAVMRDPAKLDALLPAYDSGDHLHPSLAGYKAMADAVDLALFAQ